MIRLHVHLVSDATGETLESVAKACLAQFQDVEAIKHYWPMVRSVGHLDRVMREIAERPGLIVYTLVNGDGRRKLENRAHEWVCRWFRRSIRCWMHCPSFWARRLRTGRADSTRWTPPISSGWKRSTTPSRMMTVRCGRNGKKPTS